MEVTAERSKAILAVAGADTVRGVTCTALLESVETRSADAACAGRPTLRIRPDAAAMTAAWRPTVPAFADTALDSVVSALALPTAARWRPKVLFGDTLKASPNACEVSCRIRMGVTRPVHSAGICCSNCLPASPQGLQVRSPLLVTPPLPDEWCERTVSGGRARQSTQGHRLMQKPVRKKRYSTFTRMSHSGHDGCY
ncbi:MAG: hypothetical protein JWO93_1330 [Micrococcaceae bacterium]|nr:hypothetical protein [Micrococcaceae bacterium]